MLHVPFSEMSEQMTTKPSLPPFDPNIICQSCSTQQPTAVVPCSSCGGTDHQRKSSKKCPNFVPRAPKKRKQIEVSTVADAVATVGHDDVPVGVATAEAPPNVPTTTVGATKSITTDDATTTAKNTIVIDDNVNLSKPNFILLEKNNDKTYKPVVDIADPDFKGRDTKYKIDKQIEVEDINTVLPNLMEKFFPLTLMHHLTNCSNAYCCRQKELFPNMHCWKLGASKPFNLGTMYHFLAIVYYFGLVCLPSKRDYCSSEKWHMYFR